MIKNSYILVTGASSGIGKEISINLSKYNNIILHGRDIEKLEKVKSLCDTKHNHIIWQCDLSCIDNIELSFESFISSNSINVESYVHCAGYMKMLPAKLISNKLISETFNVNVFSAALLVKILIQKNKNNSLKSVVFISSNISNMGAKAFSTYASSKGALDSLMRCLAIELAPNVRINSILPGAIPTEMTKDIFSNIEITEKIEKSYPLGIGRVSDIFGVVEFLISENSRWITGQQITVDGGRSINIGA